MQKVDFVSLLYEVRRAVYGSLYPIIIYHVFFCLSFDVKQKQSKSQTWEKKKKKKKTAGLISKRTFLNWE